MRGFSAGGLFALDSGELFVMSDLGIDRSTDDGDTWQEIEVPTTNTFIYPASGTVLYANTSTGFQLSRDAGDTWIPNPLARATQPAAPAVRPRVPKAEKSTPSA